MVTATVTSDELTDAMAGELSDLAYHQLAYDFFPAFVDAIPPDPLYKWGEHTKGLALELQAAEDRYEGGESVYKIITMPPRHGKSDQASRRFPAWHLGRHPDDEVMLLTYGADLAHELSRDAREALKDQRFKPIFPGVRLDPDSRSVSDWKLRGRKGGMHAVGLGGSVAGRGASVLVIDDYLKNRAEAESETTRQGIWYSFAHDLMTRLAPTHIVLVVATRWHVDDLVARIQAEMRTNPDFPRFEETRYPAWDDETGWLFPERFGSEWYERQRAVLGRYGWASLMQQEPEQRAGQLFDVDAISYYDEAPEGLHWGRGWDLASTAKERTKDDPDYTAGVRVAVKEVDGLRHVWVDDVQRGQWAAPERSRRMYATAERDGPGVPVLIETVAGYKDTAEFARVELRGKATVRNITVPAKHTLDVRAGVIEPICEAGHLHVRRAPWTDDFVAELRAFPAGKHDDMVAGLVTAFEGLKARRMTFEVI